MTKTTKIIVREDLTKLIAKIKPLVFQKEYQDKISDEQVLGVILAKYTEWSQEPILKAAYFALEDSNFHEDATKLEETFGFEGESV